MNNEDEITLPEDYLLSPKSGSRVKAGHRVVACIPALNEAASIAEIISNTLNYVDDVYVCDDGSSDLTGKIASSLGAHVITHDVNQGKGAGLKALFKQAILEGATVVVTLDADGQHDPSEIPGLLEPIVNGESDIVVGSRYVEGGSSDGPAYRRFGLWVLNGLARRGLRTGVQDTQSGFRAYSRDAWEGMVQSEADGYGFEVEQLFKAEDSSLRVIEVPISVRYRGVLNASKKNPVSHGAELFSLILRLILEERPLLFLGLPGALLIIGGFFTSGLLINHFNTSRYFSVPLAIITTIFVVVGMLLVLSSLMLYSISRINQSTAV